MTLYYWEAPGQMRVLSHERANTPTIEAPTDPEMDASSELSRLYVCTVDDCGRRFKKPMIIARHFNSNHDELRDDKDSWREYSKEIWE